MIRKYFLSFLLILLIIITSIAYLGNINRTQFSANQYGVKLTLKQRALSLMRSHNVDDRVNNNNDDDADSTGKTTTIGENSHSTNGKDEAITSAKKRAVNYLFAEKYPFVTECNIKQENELFKRYPANSLSNDDNYDYSTPADVRTHEYRIIKGIMVYFPIELNLNYMYEFKWLYRSWIEMQKFEPSKWRTDLIVFIQKDEALFGKADFFLNELNCSFTNVRTSNTDEPMCTLLNYTPIRNRKLNTTATFTDSRARYHHLLDNVNIFDDSPQNLNPFYTFLKEKLSNYGYVDSILMAFDGYDYLNKAGYNYLIRSDMDVFLTPLFARWLPRYCNDFYVGRGGYSSTFNVNRLSRVANELGLKFGSITNLGSTWYSTPHQFRLVAYLTLFGMGYMSEEEFTPPEREGKVGVMLWPYWHYGVLLLYGQNLFMNHLIQTRQLNIVKLQNHLDYPSYFTESTSKMLHIHVFHGDGLFSKFQFKAGKYDSLDYERENTTQAKYYSLKMALEGKRTSSSDLYKSFLAETLTKT